MNWAMRATRESMVSQRSIKCVATASKSRRSATMTDSVVVDLLRGRGRPPLSEEQKAARAAATAEQKAAAKREKLQTQAEQAGLKLVPLDQHGDSAFLAYPPDQE